MQNQKRSREELSALILPADRSYTDRPKWRRKSLVAQDYNRLTNIYLIRAGAFVKIGLAENPEWRRKNLQCGNPIKLELVEAWPIPETMCMEVERFAHYALGPKRAQGEWFEVDVDLARSVIVPLVEGHRRLCALESGQLVHRGADLIYAAGGIDVPELRTLWVDDPITYVSLVPWQ